MAATVEEELKEESVDRVQYVSLEDIENDQDELVGYRPNVDANEFAPPLAHGDYEAVVTFDATDPAKRWIPGNTKKGEPKKYYMTSLKVMTEGNTDDAFNGREYPYYASTLVRRGGTTGCQAVLQGFGATQAELDMSKTHAAQCRVMSDYIDSAKNNVTVEIDWEASYYDAEYVDEETGDKVGKEYFRLRGMERFPVAEEDQAEFPKAIEKEGKFFYPWIDLDITDKEAPVVIMPSEQTPAGRNIQRCFVRNFVRRFRTRSELSKSSAKAAAGPGGPPQQAAAATAPAAAAAPAKPAGPTGVAPRPAPRPAPARK